MAPLSRIQSTMLTALPANGGESASHTIVGAPGQKAFRVAS